MNMMWLFPVLAAGTINLACAGEHPAPQQIRQWVEQGDILSLETILQHQPLGGELLDAEVEWEDGVLVYELKWLDKQGRRHKIRVDARTGDPLTDNAGEHHR